MPYESGFRPIAAEVSAAVLFLLSPMAAYVNGTSLRVDGGRHNASTLHHAPDHDRSPRWQGFHRPEPPAMASRQEGPRGESPQERS